MEAAAVRVEAMEARGTALAGHAAASLLSARVKDLEALATGEMRAADGSGDSKSQTLRIAEAQRARAEKARLEAEAAALRAAALGAEAPAGRLESAANGLDARSNAAPSDQDNISAAYWLGWQGILRASIRLAEIDVAREVARADGLKAEAAKAKSDAEKAAADAAKAAAAEALKTLQAEALEAVFERAGCCDEGGEKRDTGEGGALRKVGVDG